MSEALLVPEGCRFLHQERMDQCESSTQRHEEAQEVRTLAHPFSTPRTQDSSLPIPPSFRTQESGPQPPLPIRTEPGIQAPSPISLQDSGIQAPPLSSLTPQFWHLDPLTLPTGLQLPGPHPAWLGHAFALWHGSVPRCGVCVLPPSSDP